MTSLATLLAALKATAEPTRLRLLALLVEAELTVTEITQILGQSQPRVSRHLKLLVDAGLIARVREGAWAFYRVTDGTPGADLARLILGRLDPEDPALQADAARLAGVREARAAAAAAYFRANAAEWGRIRALHVPEAAVEAAMLDMLGRGPFGTVLDLGTGTGRVLELLGPRATRGIGLDLSHDMLAIARVNLQRAGLAQCMVRQGDILRLPFADGAGGDIIVLHQVLHFLENPGAAVVEAARVLAPGGRLLIADFAPHDLEFLREAHAHRRLGFADADVAQWADDAGLIAVQHRALPPAEGAQGLTVRLWLLLRPEPAMPKRTAEAHA